jgi:hypothetical protein
MLLAQWRVIRSENSLTVAGAVPALLRKQRTGFPFHPFGVELQGHLERAPL